MSSLIEAFRHLPLASGLSFQNALSPRWWAAYAVTAYEDDPYHVLIECSLFVLVIWLLLRPSYDAKAVDTLTKAEEDQLIAEWKPERLTPVSPDEKTLNGEGRLIVTVFRMLISP